MEWCKLYATFATDPKVVGLSDKAFRAYVEGMCYVTLHETDGSRVPWPKRVIRELHEAGLVDDDGAIHGWLNRQRSKADVDAKRDAGRNAARIRWSNADCSPIRSAEANTEEEVEGELDVEKTRSNTASPSPNPFQPTDRQMYFGERLGIDVPAIVKMNKTHGVPAVLSAMEQVHGFPPPDGIGNAYAYVDTVASFKAAGATA